MKYIFHILSLTIMFTAICSCGQNKRSNRGVISENDTGRAVLVFSEYEHNFGKVAEGEKIAYLFSFENTGTGSLIIQDALTSCGCTASKYDRKPISPGMKGSLEVIFDTSGRNGVQTKTVTVRSNAAVPAVILKITADVVADNR